MCVFIFGSNFDGVMLFVCSSIFGLCVAGCEMNTVVPSVVDVTVVTPYDAQVILKVLD